ncbi:MAG: ImmA/IrrE family metallo-endopeptidase, partial [Rhodospirillaceae bacterium]|nr:ImmA/IrrE family metallo-endopeptidase [Rhodospirillaceae bacterium]
MSEMRIIKPGFDRHTLANQAMQAAAATRAKANLDQAGPICIYGLCETLGVVVRFNNINMEGMYQRSIPPRIHLSARRPLPRRTYNCAHELGHHVFGHGSSIDELREDAKLQPWEDPKEFLADTFAGFIL